ncbi:proline-rich protein 5-like isoform X5 [Phyllopteryx taeniolatus]|uniref:proline-rich protein 5-like isoform X5 n=1 Tax=Phyllopteryx taeniolatus TaxID=161469 RepID=UPI002AD43DF2|nr:proline-rich protein 5-like isoform X5 [Phyllopteryx taeniolatus]
MTGKQVAVVTDSPRCTMGSFRRSRPRFMSSPVLSDLSRFHARTDTPPACASAIWNSIQSAVMKIFRGGALQPNELYTLNENIRWLLKSEMGSFVTDYFQNRLLSGGLTELARRIFISGGERLAAVAEAWRRFFTETLPTLQAIFYPIQGQELSVRQMALLSFRDLVLLELPLEDSLGSAGSVPPAVTHMLLVLQGVRERGAASSSRYRHLERLAATVVSPYLEDELRPSVEASSPRCGEAARQRAGSSAVLDWWQGVVVFLKARFLKRTVCVHWQKSSVFLSSFHQILLFAQMQVLYFTRSIFFGAIPH